MPNHRQDPSCKNSTRTLRKTLFFLIVTSSRLQGHFSLSSRIPICPTHLRAPSPFGECPCHNSHRSLIEMFDVRERKGRWRIGEEISGCCKIWRSPIASENSFALREVMVMSSG
ncbi:hypothetical protein CDAR_540591 [Caerostris darwini]|uniref:Uncharacterized protein n=1 Tax=Caerostris darwini TaxID=1538125 RepID=A0AAV4VMM9_9ARAC|nr:hypothetical protein CDAR_540591 [Caerostris darwini]